MKRSIGRGATLGITTVSDASPPKASKTGDKEENEEDEEEVESDANKEKVSNVSDGNQEINIDEETGPEEKTNSKSLHESKEQLVPSFRSVKYVEENVPVITEHMKLLKRIGEGTFATVYLAESRANPQFRFALKALVPTVHSSRIENEIRILTMVGGQQNVIRLLSAMRYKDLVYLLMPHVEHQSFAEYFLILTVSEVKEYMRNLLIALRHIHHFGVIHRDVKPSNFLHNRSRNIYMLVDFGLAHMERNRRRVSEGPRKRIGSRDIFPASQTHHRLSLGASSSSSSGLFNSGLQCRCGDRLTTCRACAGLPPMGQGAQRGGTCGYRAPEVVLRYLDQTVAIDVWSAGMIFASFMAGRCPPLFASSDNDYLHKMVYLCGFERIQAACWQVGRRLLVDPAPALDTNPSYAERLSQRLTSIRMRVSKMRKRDQTSSVAPLPPPSLPPPAAPLLPPPPPPAASTQADSSFPTSSKSKTAAKSVPDIQFPPEAFDLLSRMLDPNPRTRISARDALRHPFLAPSAPASMKK